ncbi:alpha/beta fold hydrolase [Phenylobacterium sp.]|uniref:alpha/beta fold hydrolase n=1 Tax=Phenylobacterium sp. TaxID=1871053 RepID=UPI002C687DDF|nr:alpha/beta fold hydrolase [Phenylobacterium sp.]HVI34555.1 alpha/beta fold hydrolase [Phenylobacterium sp.]
MSLASLTRTEFRTELGVVPLWHAPGALASDRPVLVTVTGAFATADTMSKMQAVVGPGCDCFLMHLPGNHTPALREASVAAYAEALQAVIAERFAARPVVLVGVSIGALVALAVRAPQVRRVVAVEPPLTTGKLWPMLGPLAQKIAAAPGDTTLRDFAAGVFGVTSGGFEDRRYLHLLDGLGAPVDVVVGDRPLMPERPCETYPSFVDEPERAFLRGLPNVVLHVAPGAGHNVPFQSPMALKAVLLDALLEVGAVPPLSEADRALLSRAPTGAGRVLYVGGAPTAFAAAYRRRTPWALVTVADSLAAAPAGPFDLVALERAGGASAEVIAGRLAPEGGVLAVVEARDAAALDENPLAVVRLTPPAADGEAFDDRAADLWPLVRDGAVPPGPLVLLARARPAREPLFLRAATFAPRLMDIRTRLPAQALRSDPDLVVSLSGPKFSVSDLPVDAPKVLVLQRPALLGAEAWRRALAESLRGGWVVVMEFDDHPALVAEVKAEAVTEESWARFGYVHAVQTSTPRLAEAFGACNPEVRVFPNCAFELEPFPRTPAPRRVFYGAALRGPFAAEVAAALGPVADAHPEVEWLVVGDRAVFDALPAARKELVPYVPYEEYLRLMGTCAVSLSPIEGRRHQDTKSDVKFVEAAARGVLTIASPTIYAETIRHGETGLIAARPQDWAPLLSGVLADERRRQLMARNAWEEVRARRMFARQAPERIAWYRSLWDRRQALTEGLMDRLPGLREAVAG